MRDLARDAQRVVVAVLVGFLLYFVVWGGLPFGLGFLTGRYTQPAIQAKRDTVRLTDSIRYTIRDTVIVYRERATKQKAQSDSADAKVVIVNDSTVRVTDTLVVIPPPV